jgi:hypothetical protein
MIGGDVAGVGESEAHLDERVRRRHRGELGLEGGRGGGSSLYGVRPDGGPGVLPAAEDKGRITRAESVRPEPRESGQDHSPRLGRAPGA